MFTATTIAYLRTIGLPETAPASEVTPEIAIELLRKINDVSMINLDRLTVDKFVLCVCRKNPLRCMSYCGVTPEDAVTDMIESLMMKFL